MSTSDRRVDLTRRALLVAAAALPAACQRGRDEPRFDGGWIGASHERGHRLRDAKAGSLPAPDVQRRAGVVIVGGGVAGLACARALVRAGVDDVQLLELEDSIGGNSRGHQMGGMGCPLGAHYLPVPGAQAREVVELLEELGLSRVEHGRRVYDERHLCHSPQERLFIHGQWQEGLLPMVEQPEATLAQYRRFSAAVSHASKTLGFAIPTARAPWHGGHRALDAVTLAGWLAAEGFDAPGLLWYLDYCCRDDYGAGLSQVSAWAGVHYFASRHGFRAPGAHDAEEAEGVLTWPQGNAWLVDRIAAPLRERLHSGKLVMRVEEGRHDVAVDVWDDSARRAERWTARHVVMAVPLFIAARVLRSPPSALVDAVSRMRYAPWLVANVQVDGVLGDAGGAPPSWDNVIRGGASLGYVDAIHQSTRPYPGPTVLTSYWALGGRDAAELQSQRARLLRDDWSAWCRAVLAELAVAHPDLPGKVRRIDLMRYGHAMSIPVPGLRSQLASGALAASETRVRFAHSDLSGYSIFEEAFTHGQTTGERLASR